MQQDNEVARSPGVFPPAPAPPRRMPGEPGIWVMVFGDLAIFGLFFVTFLVAQAGDRAQFESARTSLDMTIGLVNTMVLLTSSLLVVLGVGAIRLGGRRTATRLFACSIGCGALFAVLKVAEYTHMVGAGHGPSAGEYYLYFFILTGLHLLHVLIGIGVLAFLVGKARRADELGAVRMPVVEAGACFWHLVDLLWMILFPLLYLVG